MESIFELDCVEERIECNEVKLAHTRIDFTPKVKKTRNHSKDTQRTPWWEGLSEEEMLSAREKKKHEMSIGAARLMAARDNGVNVCVDLSWDEENSLTEKRSLWKQLSLCYGCLKRTEVPIHLHITSLDEGSVTAEGLRVQGMHNWLASVHTESPWELFPHEKIIVLSPDAEHVLEDVLLEKIYVIGGIVDKTVRKGRTLDISEAMGVSAYSILCAYLHTRDWTSAITAHMPSRRQRRLTQMDHVSNDSIATTDSFDDERAVS